MSYSRKLLRCLFALIVSAVILYADLIYSFPSEINMLKNERHNAFLGAGVFIGDLPRDICTWENAENVTPHKNGEYTAVLKIANTLPFKRVKLRVSNADEVYASGELIGLRIYNRGLIVTGISSVKSGGEDVSPAKDAGIIPGDVILKINNSEVMSGGDVKSFLSESSTVTLLRHSSLKSLSISPAKDDSDGILKMGVWVRDSTAGIGTLTFFDREENRFGALGHSISDSDTGVLFNVRNGSVEKSKVLSITKGESGKPGEISGSFSSGGACGSIEKNCEVGIFGKISPDSTLAGKNYPVGVMSQVHEGKASILSTVDDTVNEYEIKILRSMPFGAATKGMLIEITDKSLLEKTGGIVQGMSGSPIVQDGKIIGAVTHVLVNDPTRGYGIFIENMLAETERIK